MSELEKAVKELEEVMGKEEDIAKAEPSLLEKITKVASDLSGAVRSLTKGGDMKYTDKPNEEDMDEEGKDKENQPTHTVAAQQKSYMTKGAETFAKSLADSEPMQEVIDASEAMADLTKAVRGALDTIEKSLANHVNGRLDKIEGMLGLMFQSHAKIHKSFDEVNKSFDAMPASTPYPGYFGPIQKGGQKQEAKGGMTLDEVSDRLEKAIAAGDLEPRYLSKLDVPGGLQEVLQLIPPSVAEKYGIPVERGQ
jgi:hypothetical protein